jgi:uncharacterized membrane protein
MDTIIDPERERSLKSVGVVSYVLHTVVAIGAVIPGLNVSVLLLVIAFILDLVKRDDARGTWQESHFAWRIRTVVIAAVLYAVTFPLFLLLFFPGWLAWVAISIWFLYRVVRGWMNLNANRPMP